MYTCDKQETPILKNYKQKQQSFTAKLLNFSALTILSFGFPFVRLLHTFYFTLNLYLFSLISQ